MNAAPRKLALLQPDCVSYPCGEECCSAGCDVWPRERAALLERGLAREADFVGPFLDDEGDWLYRTALGERGCVFLGARRGCRLHDTGLKPEVCVLAPRDPAEAAEMVEEQMLPCAASWRF
jgi:hypothetical protein